MRKEQAEYTKQTYENFENKENISYRTGGAKSYK
jgi:hypothetical protein